MKFSQLSMANTGGSLQGENWSQTSEVAQYLRQLCWSWANSNCKCPQIERLRDAEFSVFSGGRLGTTSRLGVSSAASLQLGVSLAALLLLPPVTDRATAESVFALDADSTTNKGEQCMSYVVRKRSSITQRSCQLLRRRVHSMQVYVQDEQIVAERTNLVLLLIIHFSHRLPQFSVVSRMLGLCRSGQNPLFDRFPRCVCCSSLCHASIDSPVCYNCNHRLLYLSVGVLESLIQVQRICKLQTSRLGCETKPVQNREIVNSSHTLTFEEMRALYASGWEIYVQKFGNAYQRK